MFVVCFCYARIDVGLLLCENRCRIIEVLGIDFLAIESVVSLFGEGVSLQNKSKWEKLRINLPIDVSEQRDIVKTLVDLKNQTMKVESHYQTKLASLDELKKSILQKAFAGELT